MPIVIWTFLQNLELLWNLKRGTSVKTFLHCVWCSNSFIKWGHLNVASIYPPTLIAIPYIADKFGIFHGKKDATEPVAFFLTSYIFYRQTFSTLFSNIVDHLTNHRCYSISKRLAQGCKPYYLSLNQGCGPRGKISDSTSRLRLSKIFDSRLPTPIPLHKRNENWLLRSMEIVVHSKKSLFQRKFQKKLYHFNFNKNSQFRSMMETWSNCTTGVGVGQKIQLQWLSGIQLHPRTLNSATQSKAA